MYISKCIDSFLFHCEFEKNLSPKTISAYKSDLSQFYIYASKHFSLHDISVRKIDRVFLKKYFEFLIHAYNISSVRRKLATLKAVFNFLEFEDVIEINPFRKIKLRLKIPQKLPNVLTVGEVKNIFEKAYQELSIASRSKQSHSYIAAHRDIAILELLFGTGIRISELCSLRTEQVDTINGFVKVYGKGAKERLIALCNSEIIGALRSYNALDNLESDREFFFINRLHKQVSDQSVRFMIRKYSRLANISKHITPHTFRHTFATLLLEEGVDMRHIQSLLGHSSITTTQLYTHINQKTQKRVLESYHPRQKFSMSDYGPPDKG